MPKPSTLAVESLIGYLNACGGCDMFELWAENGQPDLTAARRLAEELRQMLGPNLGVVANVEQKFNRVTLGLILETARI
jgi:hypothetical protein